MNTTALKEKLNNKSGNNTGKNNKTSTITDLIFKMKSQIQMALPKHLDVDRITRIAMTAVRTNPLLGQCEANSLLGALMQSAQLGLEPNTPLGQAYLIPYYNNRLGSYQCQFQIGYKGILDLAFRTAEYKNISAYEVYKNDNFDYCYGLEPYLKHKPAPVPEGEPIYYYAVYKLKNGGEDFKVWSVDKLVKHSKKYSKSFKNKSGKPSPWETDFGAMAKKTVLIDLLKYAPKSIELTKQLSVDETINEVSEDMSDVISVYPEQEPIQNMYAEPEVKQPANNDDNIDPGFTSENIKKEAQKGNRLLFTVDDDELPEGIL